MDPNNNEHSQWAKAKLANRKGLESKKCCSSGVGNGTGTFFFLPTPLTTPLISSLRQRRACSFGYSLFQTVYNNILPAIHIYIYTQYSGRISCWAILCFIVGVLHNLTHLRSLGVGVGVGKSISIFFFFFFFFFTIRFRILSSQGTAGFIRS